MKRLAITDYSCEKTRKKRFGNITFLNIYDGERFLSFHGEVIPHNGLGRPRSNLKLLGTDVYCKRSNRKPQDFALKSLAHAIQQRKSPSRIVEEEGKSVFFTLLSSSCGYCTFIRNEFTFVPEVQWSDMGTITFKKRNIVVKLDNNHVIRIPISTVVELVWNASGSLILTLSDVPFFFYHNAATNSLFLDVRSGGMAVRSGSTRSRLCSLGGRHAEFIGQCLVYEFHVSGTKLSQKMEQLKDYDIPVTFYQFETKYLGNFQSQLHELKNELGKYTKDGTLPFGILYLLQALVYNAYLPPATVLSLAKRLTSVSQARKAAGRKPISVHAVRKLLDLIDWPAPYGEPTDFDVEALSKIILQSDRDASGEVTQLDGFFRPTSNLARVFRVNITPSRITLHGPELEPKNRILRRFPNHHEYFLRVQFCDENGQDIHFTPQVNNDDVFSRFKQVLNNGIQIAGRTYTFLGFSHSSLRSHSVWFSAPFFDDNGQLQTYFSIIKYIGTFVNITSPARCAARIGQAFSETPFAINIKENNISVYQMGDVTSPDRSRMFSDGVGTISWGTMEAIRDLLPSRKGFPTCFQIRFGGAKGMLALDTKLHGSRIHLRPSMIKFQSTDMRHLEICDMASKPIPLFLNRQIIKIMEDMGVPESWFFRLQSLRVDQLRKATATTKNTAKFLKGQDVGESIRLYRLFLQIDQLNLDYKRAPFLRSVVEAMVLRELRLLKHKARIPVQKGITLFGIMDETGFLEENQVYVTFDAMQDRFSSAPANCRLLVTRSPALYDGDIQYVYNKLPPKDHPLTNHRNCIVFSQKGKRDLPSQLSGGDLDGDLYNIIWDPEARPLRVFAPADYPRVDPVDIGRAVTKNDMADFFVEFMKSDRLGVIATKHMILADQMELGTSHSDCRKLAQLHSTAVDFSKTGVPVRLEDMPMMNRYRPDFLAPGPQAYIHDKSEVKLEPYYIQPNPNDDEDSGPLHKYYESNKVLGKLYRAINEHGIWNQDIRSTSKPMSASFWKTLISSLTARCRAVGAPAKWEHHVETARQIRSVYEDAIYSAMSNFSDHPTKPISELEVFTGHIFNKTGAPTRRQRERSIKLKDEFDRIATWIVGEMRPRGPITGYSTEYDSLERCLACSHVAQEADDWKSEHRRSKWSGLESFQVLAVCALSMELEVHEKGLRDEAPYRLPDPEPRVLASTGFVNRATQPPGEVGNTEKARAGNQHSIRQHLAALSLNE